jgi:hypothetical protein
MTVRGLLSRFKAVRMLKLVVWFCLFSLHVACFAGVVIACTLVPDNDRADMITTILTILAGVDGGELLISAGVRLWGKNEKGDSNE